MFIFLVHALVLKHVIMAEEMFNNIPTIMVYGFSLTSFVILLPTVVS